MADQVKGAVIKREGLKVLLVHGYMYEMESE